MPTSHRSPLKHPPLLTGQVVRSGSCALLTPSSSPEESIELIQRVVKQFGARLRACIFQLTHLSAGNQDQIKRTVDHVLFVSMSCSLYSLSCCSSYHQCTAMTKDTRLSIARSVCHSNLCKSCSSYQETVVCIDTIVCR